MIYINYSSEKHSSTLLYIKIYIEISIKIYKHDKRYQNQGKQKESDAVAKHHSASPSSLRPKVKCHFRSVFRSIQIFCHTYIAFYRFLYIFWYITMPNYTSIKNNWCKSYVTRTTNAIGRAVLWRHDSSFPASRHLLPISYLDHDLTPVLEYQQNYPITIT